MADVQLEKNTTLSEMSLIVLEYRIEKLLEFQKDVLESLNEIINRIVLGKLAL